MMKAKSVLAVAAMLLFAASIQAMGVSTNTNYSCPQEQKIQEKDLPVAVSNTLKENYPGYVISEIEKETKKTGEVIYEVEFEWNTEKWEVEFSETGEILKREREEEDDD